MLAYQQGLEARPMWRCRSGAPCRTRRGAAAPKP